MKTAGIGFFRVEQCSARPSRKTVRRYSDEPSNCLMNIIILSFLQDQRRPNGSDLIRGISAKIHASQRREVHEKTSFFATSGGNGYCG